MQEIPNKNIININGTKKRDILIIENKK